MPKVKIPRKSTHVDMTAMCDVAFLLLTFFILATKQKPPEVLEVNTPYSVSSKAAPDKSIMITMTADGRAFLSLGDETKREEILADVNESQGLGLSSGELAKWARQEFYGLPFNQVKGFLNMANPIAPANMPGIPVKDSANNEMIGWVRSISNAYAGTDQNKLQQMLLVKGDNDVRYPVFKEIKRAFKVNEIYKFRIVTNLESVPVGSELYQETFSK